MPTFQIELDDGRKLRIDADNQGAALAGVQHFKNNESTDKTAPSATADVAKQVATSPVRVAEGLATWPAKLASAAAPVGNWLGRQAENIGLGTPNPQAEANRAKLNELISQQGGSRGIDQYLPQPQTPQGQLARSTTDMALQMATAPGGSLLAGAGKFAPGLLGRTTTNALLGGAAGLAGESAGQWADTNAPNVATAARIGVPLLAGGLAATVPNTMARRAASAAVPTAEGRRAMGDKAYKAIEDLGTTYNPTSFSEGVGAIKDKIRNYFGVNKDTETVEGLLSGAQAKHAPMPQRPAADPRLPPPEKAPVSTDDVKNLRRQLGAQAASKEPTERFAATMAQKELDDWMANVKPGDVLSGDAAEVARLGKEARGHWAAGKRGEVTAGRLELGELNAPAAKVGETATSRSIAALVRPNLKGEIPATKFGFNDPEIAQARYVAKGGPWERGLRKAAGVVPQTALGLGSLAASWEMNDPRYMIPFTAALGARGLAGSISRRQARLLDEMVRSRATPGWQITAPPGRLGAGPTGALLGLRAAQPLLNGYVSGGRPPIGRPSIVGEDGPEVFVPDESGTVIPNQYAMADENLFGIGRPRLEPGAGNAPVAPQANQKVLKKNYDDTARNFRKAARDFRAGKISEPEFNSIRNEHDLAIKAFVGR